jgi:hypothetical protein
LELGLSDCHADSAVMAIIEVAMTAISYLAIQLALLRRRKHIVMMQASGQKSRDINQQGRNSSCWSIGHRSAAELRTAPSRITKSYTV